MTAAAMTARMKIFLEEMDWYDWAEQAIEELYVKENKEVSSSLYSLYAAGSSELTMRC